MVARAASARAHYRPAAAARRPQAQQDSGLHARVVQRVGMHRGSREPERVPGGCAEQTFGMRLCVGVPVVMRPAKLGW